MIHRPISRRTALKGLGVSIALPLLETMVPALNLRAADATARMLDNPGEHEHRLEIHEREHDADEISRTVLQSQ